MRGKRIHLAGAAAALVGAGLVAAPQAFGDAVPDNGCADVHIIATRASTERPGAGIIGSLVGAVQRASDQTVSTEATDYPAVLNPYNQSVAAGVRALTGRLTAKAAACPDTKLVLMGYSQGAHVTGDVLASGRAPGVTAVILMGDPRYVPGKPFNAGTSKVAGLFPRGARESLDAFGDRIQSYCDTGDTFCAKGASVAVHLGYTRKYNSAAQRFVLQKIEG